MLPHTQPVPQPPPKKPGEPFLKHVVKVRIYQSNSFGNGWRGQEALLFSTVFINCISQLYFSTVFLNCISQLYFRPGEGWGGRGARLPKIPVPLPSLPPGKGTLNGYFSHSFEEVEIVLHLFYSSYFIVSYLITDILYLI